MSVTEPSKGVETRMRRNWKVVIEAPSGVVFSPDVPLTLPEAIRIAQWASLALVCIWPNGAERVFLSVPLADGTIELFPLKMFQQAVA